MAVTGLPALLALTQCFLLWDGRGTSQEFRNVHREAVVFVQSVILEFLVKSRLGE